MWNPKRRKTYEPARDNYGKSTRSCLYGGRRRDVHHPGRTIPRLGPVPARRSGAALRFPAQPDGYGLGRRGTGCRLSPRINRDGRKRRTESPHPEPRAMRSADGQRHLEGGRVERARSVRLLRYRFHQPSRHAAPLPARRLGGVSAPQGLRPERGNQSAPYDQRSGARQFAEL